MARYGASLAMAILLSACGGKARTAVPSDHAERGARIASLVGRCGLEGRIRYRMDANLIVIQGIDPRAESNFRSCFAPQLPEGTEYDTPTPRESVFLGPPEARPADADLAEIERRVSGQECSGDAARGWRLYAYHWENGQWNRNRLHFQMQEAGPTDYAGRTVYSSHVEIPLTHPSGRAAAGEFDPLSRRMSLAYCGPSSEPVPRASDRP